MWEQKVIFVNIIISAILDVLVLLLVPLLNISDFLICYIEVWSSSELCEEVFTTCETQEWSETDQNVYVPFETRHHDHPAYNCYDYNDDELCVVKINVVFHKDAVKS